MAQHSEVDFANVGDVDVLLAVFLPDFKDDHPIGLDVVGIDTANPEGPFALQGRDALVEQTGEVITDGLEYVHSTPVVLNV